MRNPTDARAYLPSSLVAHARNSSRRLASLTIAGIAALLSGCAVQYYDPETGTTHVWGFGHLSMKMTPLNEGLQAVIRGTTVFGLSLGTARDRTYLTIGYDSEQQTDIVDQNASVHLDWPAGDLFAIRAGSSWPATNSNGFTSNQQPQRKETPGGIEDE